MIAYTVKVGSDGYESWYLNGQLHREGGPAVTYPNGTEYWYLNGKLHRVAGPAVEYSNGDKEWYLNGKEVTKEQVLTNTSCHGKVVEIDGKKYKLEEV